MPVELSCDGKCPQFKAVWLDLATFDGNNLGREVKLVLFEGNKCMATETEKPKCKNTPSF